MKNIPSAIFDLVATKPFDELTETEKKLVLSHITELDYNELHEGALIINNIVFTEGVIDENKERKELVLNSFKRKNRKLNVLQTPIALWKVAASFLITTACMYWYFNSKNVVNKNAYLTLADTVYIEKQIQGPTVFDTIYLPLEKNAVTKLVSKSGLTKSVATKQHDYETVANTGLNRLSISDLEKNINSKKGKNIKEDTLISNLGFATL